MNRRGRAGEKELHEFAIAFYRLKAETDVVSED